MTEHGIRGTRSQEHRYKEREETEMENPKYVAVELKTLQDGTFTVSTYKKDNIKDANKAYHSILAGAATSDALYHAAVILDWKGNRIKGEFYANEPVEPEEPMSIEEPEKEGE